MLLLFLIINILKNWQLFLVCNVQSFNNTQYLDFFCCFNKTAWNNYFILWCAWFQYKYLFLSLQTCYRLFNLKFRRRGIHAYMNVPTLKYYDKIHFTKTIFNIIVQITKIIFRNFSIIIKIMIFQITGRIIHFPKVICYMK